MNIVHTVEFYYPSKGGSQEVVRQLSERLVAMGHNVTVVTTKLSNRQKLIHNGVKIKEFAIEGNEVRGYSGDTQAYRDFIAQDNFDVIMNYAAQQWTSDLVFDLLPKLKARKVFVPCGFSGLHDPAYEEYFKKMPSILKSYDATIYLSPTYRDTIFAKKHSVKNRHVIPNGANEQEFLPAGNPNIREKFHISSQAKLIMHLGSFTGEKGQAEAIEIFSASQLPNATLLLVGNVYDKKTHKRLLRKSRLFNLSFKNILEKRRIKILNIPRQDTVDLLKSADLFLFPSNIEASPLVLFEACAAKTPFLTSDVGNAAEIIEWTGGGEMLATDKDKLGKSHVRIAEAAQQLDDCMQNPAKLKSLSDRGFAAWKQKFTWEKITQQYLDVYSEGSKK